MESGLLVAYVMGTLVLNLLDHKVGFFFLFWLALEVLEMVS